MVRGAYINEENNIAREKGIESPCCQTMEETTAMIEKNLKFIIDNKSGNSEVIIRKKNYDFN